MLQNPKVLARGGGFGGDGAPRTVQSSIKVSPEAVLRISLFKVSKEERVSKVLQAGSIVSRDVDLTWEVECKVVIPVRSLVPAGPVAEVHGHTGGSDRAFLDLGHGRGVVGSVGNGGIADVVRSGHKGDLAEQAGMLKVTAVHDGPRRVLCAHELALDDATDSLDQCDQSSRRPYLLQSPQSMDPVLDFTTKKL